MGSWSWGALSLVVSVWLLAAAAVWWLVRERFDAGRDLRLQKQRFGFPLDMASLLEHPERRAMLASQVRSVVVIRAGGVQREWLCFLVDATGDSWDLEWGSDEARIRSHAEWLAQSLEVPVQGGAAA